jgi:multidrug resistance efflux pump
MQALDADGMSPTLLAVILVAGLGGVWTSWLALARVPVYQLSEVARLEVERIHPVAAPVMGRVVATSLLLGRDVRQGDVLLEVDADREWLATQEERVRLAAVNGEIEHLQREIVAEQGAIEDTVRAASAAIAEASQRLEVAEASAQLAQDKVRRINQLEKSGLVSATDGENARAEEQGRRAELAAARSGIERLRAEQTAAERGRRGRIASLLRERTGLEGLRDTTASSVALREREAERRRVRAPVSGRLGAVASVQIGAIVREGDHLASIVPQGRVRAVAEFAAPALGRIRPEQRARLRLEGFSWTQYGHVEATVTSVASETRDQRVRVELAVNAATDANMPLEHGMPGVVEVEVERVAPLTLLVRSLGHSFSGRSPAPSSTQTSSNRATR